MSWILMAALLLAAPQALEVKSGEQQIDESLAALPEALRAGAGVVGYDASGKRVELKEGTNGMTCWADDPRPDADWGNPYYVVCFPESLAPFFLRVRELKDGKVPDSREILTKEIDAGKIPMPDIAVRYSLRGEKFVEALPLTVIHVPYRKQDGTGFSTAIDHYRPWLMWAGTPLAHIMVPGH